MSQQEELLENESQSISPIDEDPWGMIAVLVPVAGAIAWIALAMFTGLN